MSKFQTFLRKRIRECREHYETHLVNTLATVRDNFDIMEKNLAIIKQSRSNCWEEMAKNFESHYQTKVDPKYIKRCYFHVKKERREAAKRSGYR